MAWIKTVANNEIDMQLAKCMEESMKLYPPEYAVPVESIASKNGDAASIVMSHSLLPEALQHAFSTFGVLMQAKLPLTRRQHELIAATVSALNNCFY